MSDKKSFLLYKDFSRQMDLLSVEQAGHFIKAIFAFQSNEPYECADPIVAFALEGVLSQFGRDDAKYADRVAKCSDAGRKSAERRLTNANKRKHKSTDPTDSVSVSDSVSDSVSEKKTPKALIAFALGLVDEGSRKELIKEWLEYRIDLKKPMKTEVGLKKMVSEWSKYTDTQVRQVMDFTISKEYQGMIWDKLGNSTSCPAQQTEYKGPTV